MDAPFGYHPNLTYTAEGGTSMQPEEVAAEHYGAIDNSPKYVGALVLAALVGLIAMKAAGFRFSFGVSAGR